MHERRIARQPDAAVAWCFDVGSKSAFHAPIAELAERGLAVLVISSEMRGCSASVTA